MGIGCYEGDEMTAGVSRILREREHQIRKWSKKHDATHKKGELANAASFLALTNIKHSFKETPQWVYRLRCKYSEDRIRQLEIAGALIAAEIERLLGKL